MRKFKTCPPRSLPFRLLVILAGALLLLAAFAPCANAQGLLRFYDFEASTGPHLTPLTCSFRCAGCSRPATGSCISTLEYHRWRYVSRHSYLSRGRAACKPASWGPSEH